MLFIPLLLVRSLFSLLWRISLAHFKCSLHAVKVTALKGLALRQIRLNEKHARPELLKKQQKLNFIFSSPSQKHDRYDTHWMSFIFIALGIEVIGVHFSNPCSRECCQKPCAPQIMVSPVLYNPFAARKVSPDSSE